MARAGTIETTTLDEAQAPARSGWRSRIAVALRTRGERLVLQTHELACRWDLTPTEFGRENVVDETDATAVLREWRHQLRRWAAYNPEEVFAIKAGAAVLGAALILLWVLVGALR